MTNNIPDDLESFLQTFRIELPVLLGDVLLGIYVYGSLSYGNFEKHRSDVDIIVVIRCKLNNKEFDKLKKFYASDDIKQNKWFNRLEMDYVICPTLKDFSFILKNGFKATHFAHSKLRRMAESDGGNPINWMNIRQCGITLFGPFPQTFVPKIEEKIILSAVRKGFWELKSNLEKWIRKDLWHQTYMVVMLCRIACTLEESKMVSKKEAAKWGIKKLPIKFKPIIITALKKMDDSVGPLDQTITEDLPALMNYVDNLFYKRLKNKATS